MATMVIAKNIMDTMTFTMEDMGMIMDTITDMVMDMITGMDIKEEAVTAITDDQQDQPNTPKIRSKLPRERSSHKSEWWLVPV